MRKALLVAVALGVATVCTTASAQTSYTNTTGGTVYQLNAPTSWANIGADPIVLSGAGPDGGDAWYKPGAVGGVDDSTQAYWDFTFANLPNVGTELLPGQYAMQAYVSDYGDLEHENDAVFGSANGPWGYHTSGGLFSSWNGVPQSTPGWTDLGNWTGGYVWLSSTDFDNGIWNDVTVGAKWNAWSGYGGAAVSGVRISTDGNFEVPEPASLLLLGLGGLFLKRRK
ncbi:MAG: PEP-CTERM sorting domain-containing protein [Phycisphaerae bacterium]|nr:PEP-CTERM sorting domain-containing protein [Phycisphaerae bacterium]